MSGGWQGITEGGGVPGLSDVREIVVDNGPETLRDGGVVVILHC